MGAVEVARMPRAIGTITGVKEMRMPSGSWAPEPGPRAPEAPGSAERWPEWGVGIDGQAATRAWRISGMCRWLPPTAYGLAVPSTSDASRFVFRLLPAPDGPTASTLTMSAGSMTPAVTPGARLRLTVEALQPGAAMRVAVRSFSRCLEPEPAGSSGTP